MTKRIRFASLIAAAAGVIAGAAAEPAVPDVKVRVDGPFGERLHRLIANHVKATDVRMLTDIYKERTRNPLWQTEFWGKYMHAAAPFWTMTGDEALGRKIEAGVENLLPSQEPCGYLGNYLEAARCGRGWDVWGMKYTMLGLLHYYDAARPSNPALADKALTAAMRQCDYLIGQLGPNGARGIPLRDSGAYGGLPSCSVLEPVVWLYDRIRARQDLGGESAARKYLDFATYIVRELTEFADGPQLVKQADVPVADRRFEQVLPKHKWHPEVQLTKAYEMMSCYQGLLDYHQVTGRKDLLDAAVKTGRSIVDTEVNLAGGAAAGEHWFRGAENQHRHISWQQETCVITTWMRFCEKLHALTGDALWADQLERTFYGAYLGAMDMQGARFAAYSPLMGYRSPGHHHCKMHTDCCNMNGPRGYLAVLNRILTAENDAATLSFYFSGHAEATLPATGAKVAFHVYTLYPRTEKVEIWYRGKATQNFALRLRIPAFAQGATVKVNGKDCNVPVVPGSYCELRREWRETDSVELNLPLPVKMHRLHEYVAFTRGPLALARDTRFNDGALDDEIRANLITDADLKGFSLVQADDPALFMAVAATLPAGYHTEDPDNGVHRRVIHFTDYASAGNLWRPDNRYRVWLPELIPGRQY